MSKILIDRAIVEQALETLNAQHIEWFMSKRVQAIEVLRSALDKPDCKLVGWWHDVEDPDECDFFYADAINGDCPSCHPCCAAIGGEA